MRRILPFNDGWSFAKPGETPVPVTLPHTWNAIDGQDGGNDYWRGTAAYTKTFDRPETEPGERVFLSFDGVGMTADVSLNGHSLCRHEGGYSTFRVDITDVLADRNELTVLADNSQNDRVYPQKADFTFYGGIYRDVSLIIVPAEHFELVKSGTPGLKVTPVLKDGFAEVTVETWQNTNASVRMTVNGETKEVPSEDGHAVGVFKITDPHLWNGVEDPYLYTAEATLPSGDRISARFGVRSIAFNPEKGFFLNGKSYPLRGVSRHQDREGIGNALLPEHHREDIALIREIGANTVRLAHYQHAQCFYDLCDEAGLIVWAEIPYITEHMPNGRANTLSQMRELITQCYNHPSIVCWGLSNEITAASPVDEDLQENHRLLNDLCHRMDATRPTTMAHVFMLETDSPLIGIADIGSYNLYFGWYLGELSQNEAFFDKYHAEHPDRVIGFSEYGADTNVQFHSSAPERGDYTEEYQCRYHEHILNCIEQRPFLWATHVWNMFDFAADGRDEGGKKGVNQKGLVTMDRKLKKDAFYLYKAAWSRAPFVHLCGSRYTDRIEDETEIKVYSNLPTVTLYMDGAKIGEQTGQQVFTFRIRITEEHLIRAVAGDCSDKMTVRRAAEPNPAYRFLKQEVVNWFDREEIDPAYYSVRDTLGDLRKHPQSMFLLETMMDRMRAARGDVARSTAANPMLAAMMQGMTLESLLRQAGNVPAETVRQLNETLQQIPKADAERLRDNWDPQQMASDIHRVENAYDLDDRFVLRDGKRHPFAVICPGGAYTMVCSYVEGVPFAKRLNEMGISAFIVYYRVRELARFPAPQDDLARAVREILTRADEYGLDIRHYSVWGSSAGGHLAASFGTTAMGYSHYGLPKPEAMVLVYPVISMDREITENETHNNLLGAEATKEQECSASVDLQVDANYPPTYIWCGDADRVVKPENTKRMADALRAAGIPYRCEIFPGIDHGVGLAANTAAGEWFDHAAAFWKQQMTDQ
ncbi:MAG: alpha/beta hydrolase fold domain-containing protein [Clostridia bacterium]|nr:alpha/beta hydrolase fold domain-containing protein [Clostridia bacterium]